METLVCALTRRSIDFFNERIARPIFVYCLTVAMLGAVPTAVHAQTDVLTNRSDPGRSGANLAETKLTPANVNVNQFGKLYSYPVDGAVYAQPLYVTGVTINGGVHNVLYVATMNDKVYAFDADSKSSSPLWVVDFTNPAAGVIAPPMLDIKNPANNIFGNVGIESTPVIDKTTSTLYLVARTEENGNFVQRLHALNITTGQPRPGSPTTITAVVPGSATDSTVDANGQRVITFDPKLHQQRAGLALTNGVVLVAWAGHEDMPPYHGWIMGFDATTLAQVGAFAVVADNDGGGIWQGGRAPTIDKDGNAYFATGNGKWDGTRNFGDSLLKLSVGATGLSLLSSFTPSNEDILDMHDSDLSGSGFTLLPETNLPGKTKLLLGGGKEGVLYLLSGDNLGGKQAGDPQVIQKIDVSGGHVMGGPVFWTSDSTGTLVYNWSEADVLLCWQLTADGLFSTTTPYAKGHILSPGHPGGSLTISANGSAAHTGIVWAYIPTYEDAKHILTGGTLRAFDAETLTEIWNSDLNSARDKVGTLIKFVPPVVVNGKVYVPTQDNAVAVYGPLPIGVPDEIVLYAKRANPIAGTWHLVDDTTAAGGVRIEHPDAGAPKVPAPLASPVDYFELTFTARANTPYHLWLHAKAQNNSYNNDSVYVQFSGSLTNTGTPINRIGTTQAATVVLEDCSGCGVAGWGWQDNAYGLNVLGPAMYFTDGPQTIRIQGREDGISIDEIVLSPAKYLTTSPGVPKNDTTILPEQPPPSGTIVRYPGTDAMPYGNWRVVDDTSAAGGKRIENPDAGAPKIAPAMANPVNYFELTFTAEANKPYRLWLHARAQADSYNNDSVYVQFSGSVTSTGAPTNRIGTTQAVPIVLEDCAGCGVAGWGWQDNGYGTGVLGPVLYFTAGSQTIRVQQREDGISIDQIVLSPDTYLNQSPGAPKNDTKILNKTP
jgi:hypothetical protein